MTRQLDEAPLTAKIPADVDQPDKLMYGLTGRQLAVLAVTALASFGIFTAVRAWLPLPMVIAAVFPVVAAGVVVAVARRDGMGLDRFALAALNHLRMPKERVTASEPIAPPPAWCRMRGQLPSPLQLPVRAVREDGVMELTEGGTAVLVRAGTVAFALRTASEQTALVAMFGRWLNSLDTPVQILVRARPMDLSGLAWHLTDTAPALPDPALERAALDYAAFLTDLHHSRNLLIREVLIVIGDHTPTQATPWLPGRKRQAAREVGAAVVLRRAAETERALAALGVTAEVLDADACTAALAEALSPGETHILNAADPDEVITASAHDQEASR
ncbi:PrgI family protein [Actinomadura barringtoniae]|uniref:PrgI family protein n=1 Tax=Actinomadura barringtoniae TaxID=1427535 RepID=A0A939PF21_9ACTN|nr:PrgI family protein [Actinomadura barringtoniae]MBO2451662.1 PrgI family protein [Actinomadura barringtoniae]